MDNVKDLLSFEGAELNMLAVCYANAIASDFSKEELTVLSSWFSLIGDAPGVLSGTAPL